MPDQTPLPAGTAAPRPGAGDVARVAGVSRATVSRALTMPGRVREDTRDRVLLAARLLGYTPNEAARSLRAGTSRMVLVLAPYRRSEAFFAGVLSGIDAELSASGYTMIIGNLEASELKARRLHDLVFARHFDGVIVLTSLLPTFDGRSVLDAGVPVVAICAELDRAALQTVLIDDEGWAAAQTKHLIGLGHRRLMYLSGPGGSYNDLRRYAGFKRAAKAAGLRARDLVREPGDYSLASGVVAAARFLERVPRPTGIVAASDEMAIGLIKTLARAGVRCPDEVSVIGFDGIDYAEFCEPTLTTIRQPRHELGAVGARALVKALRGEQDRTRMVVLPAELLERASTGKPPAS